MSPSPTDITPPSPALAAGGGDTGQRLQQIDWRSSPLGPPDGWPGALRTVVRLVLASRRALVVFWGPEGLAIGNEAASLLLDGEPSAALQGQPAHRAWPAHWGRIGPQVQHVLQGGGGVWIEHERVPAVHQGCTGDTCWTCSYDPIADDTAATGVGGVLLQITDSTAAVQVQRSAQTQTQATDEAGWRAWFEHAPGLVCILAGAQHRCEFVNPRFQALAGGRVLVGRPLAEALPELQAQGFVAQLDQAYRRCEPYTVSALPLRFGHGAPGPGQLRHLDLAFQPLCDAAGQVTGIVVQGTDVTERVQATAALADSEARHRALSDHLREAQARLDGVMAAAEVGVWSWDLQRDVVECDLNLAHLYGLGPVTHASPAAHLARIHPDDRPAMQAAIDQAMVTGRLDAAEYRVTDASGTLRWLMGRGRLQRDAQGRPERLTGLVIDISRLKLLEQSLQASDRQKDEFLAILAHELRNPLAPLLAAARVLDQAAPGSCELARCRDVIRRQVQQMAVLLDDLLDVSRIKHGRLRLDRRPVTLAEVVDTAVETAMPWIEARGHRFTQTLPPEPVLLHVDPGRLAQVLANLLGNAARYTPTGGHIELRARLCCTAPGREVDIVVQDDGIGLSAADQAHIFQMFAQIETGSAQSQGGLGIGLALVKGLVELHGGRVRVDSDGPGRGSVFTVSLPVHAPAAGPALPAPPHAPGPQAPRRILIADDNADAAEMMALFLRLGGHTLRVAHEGHEAVAAYDDFAPDIALIDIGMPGLDGYEVARHIRRQGRGPQALLVALTGWGQEDDKLKAEAAGFDLHFTKPVDPDELMRRVEQALPGPRLAPVR